MSIKLFENSEYKENIQFYKEAYDLYEGCQAPLKASNYLWLHELETKPEGARLRKLRETRSSYTNFVEPFISLWQTLFFRKEPILSEETVKLLEEQDLKNNIDGNGTTLYSFIQNKLILNALLYGFPIIRANAIGTLPKNYKEQQETNKYRPYLQVVCPMQFVDWAVEKTDPTRLNKLNFCRLEYIEEKARTKATDAIENVEVSIEYQVRPENGENIVYFIRYEKQSKSNRSNAKKDWVIVEEVPMTGWKEIPFALQLEGVSWVKDLLPHVLKYYNLESVLDNICLFQAHQRTFFAGDLDGMEMVAAAEYSYTPLPKDTQVITVDPTPSSIIENRLNSVLDNIFRIALNQTRTVSSDSKAVQASDTLREEKESMYDLIKAEAEAIEALVNSGINMLAEFKGLEGFKSDFKFNLESLETDVEATTKLVMLYRDEISNLPTARKQLITNALSSLNVSQSKELTQEIEDLVLKKQSTPEVNVKDSLLNGFNNRPVTQ